MASAAARAAGGRGDGERGSGRDWPASRAAPKRVR